MAIVSGSANADVLAGTTDADTITGGDGADQLYGLGGNDSLSGGSGSDTLIGGVGNDTMNGGADGDVYYVDSIGDVIVEGGNGGTNDSVVASVDYALTQGAEVEFLGYNAAPGAPTGAPAGGGAATAGTFPAGNPYDTTSNVAINLTGNEFRQVIQGTGGANLLIGGRNSDATTGDTLAGYAGDDTYLISNPNDRLVNEAANGGNDTVFVSANSLNSQGQAVATFSLLNAGANGTNFGNDNSAVLGIENLSAQDQSGSQAMNLTGSTDNQIISGNQGNNTLAGGGGLDTLNGFNGDDTYVLGRVVTGGVDTTLTVIGQETGGNDTVNFVANAAGYNFTTFNNGSMANLEIERINANAGQHVVGNNFGQTIAGTTGSETLEGGAGMDTIIGGTGDDFILVDMDGETVVETASTTIGGTAVPGGTDTVIYTGGATATGLSGYNLADSSIVERLAAGISTVADPYFFVSSSLDLNGAAAGTPGVYLVGNTTSQIIYGAGGADILDGDRGSSTNADTLYGGSGNDTYRVYSQADIVGEGTFSRDGTVAAGGTNAITYNATTDAGGNDTIFTSASYSLAANVAGVPAAGGNPAIAGNGGGDFIENLVAADASSTTAYTLTGSGIANQIVGAAGNDTISGGVNADVNGNPVADTLIGLGGNDTYNIQQGNEVIREAANGGNDTAIVANTVAAYTLTDNAAVEVLRTATGRAATANVTLTGNSFAQTIQGGAGNDTLAGGGGADTLIGGDGNDTYRVVNDGVVIQDTVGTNTVEYRGGAGTGIAVGNGASISTITTNQDGGVYLVGNNGVQSITGGAGNDTLNGNGGVDAAGLGDTLSGGAGDDIFRVFTGNFSGTVVNGAVVSNGLGDSVVGGDGNDTIFTSASYVLGADVENLVSANQSIATNITLVGNTLNNAISGDQGNNVLYGAAGNDRLTGLGGADTFHFSETGVANADTIVDFVSGTDRISLDLADFGALGATFDANELTAGRQAVGTNAQIIYDQATGQMFYDADGTGTNSETVLFAQLQPGTAVTAADFVLTPANTIPTP